MTFSIAAADPVTGECGVAVASKFIAVGAVVPWMRAGVGAVATQALANVGFGPNGLALLGEGIGPQAVVERLLSIDEGGPDRQLGLVAADGSSATFTGARCLDWAGDRRGPGYAIQGNLLAGPEVVEAMEATWLASVGRPFAWRLHATLLAGDRAGGDRRGRQSASLHVRQVGAGYGGFNDRKVELRVDDHPDPVPELERLMHLHELSFGRTPADQWAAIEGGLAAELRVALRHVGQDPGEGDGFDLVLEAALLRWVDLENLEERWSGGPRIDPVVVARLRAVAAGDG